MSSHGSVVLFSVGVVESCLGVYGTVGFDGLTFRCYVLRGGVE